MKKTDGIPFVLLLLSLGIYSCKERTVSKPINTAPVEVAAIKEEPEFDPEDEVLGLNEIWKGDLDSMIARGRIRALIPYNRTIYYINGTKRGGIGYEALNMFEKNLNERLGKRPGNPGYVNVIFIPMTRDKILPSLKKGYGDLAAANLVMTEDRIKELDFSIPSVRDWEEMVVTGPASRTIRSFEDLLGDTLHIRKSSSYFWHLEKFNDSLQRIGKPIIHVKPVEEHLEDDDILELVNAGVIPATISNNYTTRLWREMLPEIQVHKDLSLIKNGDIGWAMRLNSPKLKEAVDGFMRQHRQGSLMGNILLKKFHESTNYLKRASAPETIERFLALRSLFIKYGEQYDWDWLLLTAQGYQESQLDHSRRSPAGAVGIMQIKPSTAADPNIGITDVYNLENNIHASAKYLNFLRERYFSDPEIDDLNGMLLSLAAYNMGPARMNRIRKQAAAQGLDPNIWFGQVELIAAREIGRETGQYVSNIYKYYSSFRSLLRYGKETGKSYDSQ